MTNNMLRQDPTLPRRPSADRYGWGLALLAAGCVVVLIMGVGMSEGHSAYLNMSWFLQYREVLLQGSLPRHLPDLWGGLGGLDFFFYGHLPYLVASLLSPLCVGCSDQQVFSLAVGVGFSTSVLAFFALAKRFTGPVAALFASIVYAILPYHLGIDLIWRQAVGEVWAYAFTPLIARGIDMVLRERRSVPGLAISSALLLATHLPTALLAAHVFGAVFLAWCLVTREAAPIRDAVLRLLWSSAIGLALAASFWLPAVTLLADVTPEALRFDPTLWLLSFGALGHPGDPDTMRFVLWSLGLSCPTLALVALSRQHMLRRPEFWLWVLVPGLLVLFLMSGLSLPFWQAGLLPRVQFPFRLMVFLELATALAVAFGLDAWMRSGKGPGFAAFVITLMGAAALNMHIQLRAAALKPEAYLPHLPGVVEYLPHDFTALARDRNWDKSMWLFVWDVSRKAQNLMRDEGTQTVMRSSREIVIRAAEGRDQIGAAVPWWRYWQARDAVGDLVLERDMIGLTRIRTPDGRLLSGDIRLSIPLLGIERLALLLGFVGMIAAAGSAFWACRRPKSSGAPSN